MIPSLNLSHVHVHRPQSIGTVRKLFSHLEHDDYILEMDWSSINHFLTCWRASEFALVYSRVMGRTPALTYGSALHLSLEAYYRGERDVAKLLQVAAPEFEANPPGLGEWRNMEALEKAIKGYIEKYSALDAFQVKTTISGELMVEQAFSTPLCEIEINNWIPYYPDMLLPAMEGSLATKLYINKLYVQWTGVIDIAAEDGPDHDDLVIDHKTTSIGGPTYYDQFDLSQQTRGYCWAMSQLTGRPCRKFMANVIEGRAPTAKGKGNSLDFQRKWVTYTDEQISKWQHDMTSIIKDFIAKLVAGDFPENTHSCIGKFGKCSYLDVCRLPEKMRGTMLASDVYTSNIWNPLS